MVKFMRYELKPGKCLIVDATSPEEPGKAHSKRTNNQLFKRFNISNSESQLFARKVVRVLGQVTEQDLLKYARVVDELNVSRHDNLVQVLNHGWLPESSSFYFIDMELCSYDFSEYIQNGNTPVTEAMRLEDNKQKFFKQLKTTVQI